MALQGIKVTMPAEEPVFAAPPVVPFAAAAYALGGGVVIDPSASEHEREEEDAVLSELEDFDLDLTDEDFIDVLGRVLGIDPPPSEHDERVEEEDFDLDLTDDYNNHEYVDNDGQPPADVVAHGAAAPNVVSLVPRDFLWLSPRSPQHQDVVVVGHSAAVPNIDTVLPVRFLYQRSARFASVHNTAMFMRINPEAAAPGGESSGAGEILVHYRYTRFVRAEDWEHGVDAHVLGPKEARVRFHLPANAAAAASDPATTLQLAGAALAPLLYPARFSAELRAMWCALVAAWPVPRATPTTRVVVTVDAGILRPTDWTPLRMRCMAGMVECVAQQRLFEDDEYPVGAELLLPAPLVKEDDVRPAKRRRVAGEDCPICYEALEQGLAVWPRCSHIFHARCLGEYLGRGSQECPICRSGLQVDA